VSGTDVGLSTLTAGVLDEEEARLASGRGAPSAGERGEGVEEADLPGVGDDRLNLRQGLAMGGGAFTFWILLLLNSLDELESAAMQVLGPDIGSALGVSDGVVVFLTASSAAFIVLGIVPLGWLSDRSRRAPIVGVCSLLFGAFALLSGMVTSAFQLFWARFGAGVAKANTIPVHGSLLADTYPIGIRGRIGSTIGTTGRAVAALSPMLVGGIAVLFGGEEGEGWRWAFALLGLPVAVVAVAAFRIKEPIRGRWEKTSVVGAADGGDPDEVPVSVEMAFARLGQIRSLRAMVLALSAIGFQIFPMVAMTNFFLEDTYDLDAFQRGLVTSGAGALTVLVGPLVGSRFDALYRIAPPRAMRIVSLLILPGALLTPLQFNMPNAVLFTLFAIPGTCCSSAAWAMVGPMFQSVVPYRLRALGVAYGAIFVFLFGAVGGSLVGSGLASSLGERTAIIIVSIPSALIGAAILWRGAGSIRGDLAMIGAEIHEEEAERERLQTADAEVPLLQMVDVDFSYGHVQTLFGVDLEVAEGEVLALLGTNGAGKSTILRVIAGLGTPSRGAVRLRGRTITYASPEQRNALGIQLLPGGKGVFGSLSVEENLEMGAYTLSRAVRAERIERAWDLFPGLVPARRQAAGSLSGGQQQQLALARVLLHDPELLIIDELSLGLAPAVVADLLITIEQLKAEGQAMLIVEQSLNVALGVADRAIFLEKGSVRFTGPTEELLERDDLARAVFLGGES
jgi:ABC-type branched-subunit amino acid transport system ATPase component/predicted MFS family arabinose efflux permease